MTILSRRTVLAGAASASALPSFALWSAQSASAATDPAGKQAASFYRYKVGDIEVTVLSDGIARVPVTEAFVLNVKPEEVNAALREAYMEPGVFIGPYNPIVLNNGTKLVLIDMGTGEANYIATQGVAGQRRQVRFKVVELGGADLALPSIAQFVEDRFALTHHLDAERRAHLKVAHGAPPRYRPSALIGKTSRYKW